MNHKLLLVLIALAVSCQSLSAVSDDNLSAYAGICESTSISSAQSEAKSTHCDHCCCHCGQLSSVLPMTINLLYLDKSKVSAIAEHIYTSGVITRLLRPPQAKT